MEKGATHGKQTVPRETGLAFLEALAATVTPTPEQREAELDIEYFEDPKAGLADRVVVVELYDDDRVLLARATIR